MKGLLIRVFLWPSGLAAVVGISLLILLVAYMPNTESRHHQANSRREEFPGQRRGGGTHWVNPLLDDIMV